MKMRSVVLCSALIGLTAIPTLAQTCEQQAVRSANRAKQIAATLQVFRPDSHDTRCRVNEALAQGQTKDVILIRAAQLTALQAIADVQFDRTFNTLATMAPMRRTNVQYGAAPGAPGSTSALEKAGIPDFLAYAIEHGAIDKDINGTTMTLSASAYSLLHLGDIDPPGTQTDVRPDDPSAEFWKGVGASVSFNLQNNPTGSLANLNAQDVSEYAVKVAVNKPRESNSAFRLRTALTRFYVRLYKSADNENTVRNNILQDFGISALGAVYNRIDQELAASMKAGFTELGIGGAKADAISALTEANLGNLKGLADSAFSDSNAQVAEQQIELYLNQLYENTRAQFSDRTLVSGEVSPAFNALGLTAQTAISAARQLLPFIQDAQEQNKVPLFTLGYTGHTAIVQGSADDSELKVLGDWSVPVGKLVCPNDAEACPVSQLHRLFSLDLDVDSGVAFYNKSNHALNQGTLRDYHFTGLIGGAAPGLFGTKADVSRITYSLTGRYEKLEENSANIGVFQAKIEIPLTAGIHLPISFTYATRTELINEKEKRGNIGFTFDPQALLGLRKLIGK
jgi:hypothetical protein